MNWTEIKIKIPVKDIETAAAIAQMTVPYGIYIEDYSNLESEVEEIAHIDLIDEDLLKSDRNHAVIHIYISPEENPAEAVSYLKEQLALSDILFDLDTDSIQEEDWSNEWKKYYHPIRVGKKIIICPSWESCEQNEEDVKITLDPGMAFGTGTHETTRLMIRLLEDYTQPGCRMLDVGTGTGILAICASRLGAGVCRAYDIDPTAVRVARENIRESGLTNITCDRSDLLRQVDLHDGRYDLITANIVADILIRMMPDVGAYLAPDGVLLLSGIVEERCADVIASADANGYSVETRLPDNGWCALALRRKR